MKEPAACFITTEGMSEIVVAMFAPYPNYGIESTITRSLRVCGSFLEYGEYG